MLLVHLCIATLFVLKLCSTEGIPCTCTQVGGETHYSVPEFIAPNCPYQWCNGSNYVIANQNGAGDQVLRKSNRTLVTRGCSPPIHYRYNCFAEGIQLEAICNFNCSTKASPQEEYELPEWVVPVSVLVVLVLLVLLVLCICYGITSCKKKNKCTRTTDNGSSDEEQRL